MTERKILVVDDERHAREALRSLLTDDGYEVYLAGNGEEAMPLIREVEPDVILSDLKMPLMDGMELLKKAKALDPRISFIIMTAFGTIENAVQAMKMGAENYITKPINVDEIEVVIEKAIEKKRLIAETENLKERLRDKYSFNNIIGSGAEMQLVFKTIEQVAPSRASVLILGESGTGKELVAEAIHQLSPRVNGPFIKVNCAALSESLLESELFGHEKGAFTGAVARREGRFELADGGTLFLDEVGDIPLQTQVKILRFLQEKTFERVGGSQPISVDVRLITATNQDLEVLIDEGDFRKDLYYRINVVSINMPPLRQRKSDIPHLIDFFIRKYKRENNKEIKGIVEEALQKLCAYDWPGNVRELENIIERAVVLCQNDLLGLEHLPPIFQEVRQEIRDSGSLVGMSWADIEKKVIMDTLESVNGSTARAAEILGISIRKIQYKLKEYRGQVIDGRTKRKASKKAEEADDPEDFEED